MENNATEINDVAPSSLSHLIGQRGVIDQVKVALDAAQMDGKKFDHALLVGGPGLGKSQLAPSLPLRWRPTSTNTWGSQLITQQISTCYCWVRKIEMSSTSMKLTSSKNFQTALYLAIDKRKLIIQGGKTPMTLPLADFTLLL